MAWLAHLSTGVKQNLIADLKNYTPVCLKPTHSKHVCVHADVHMQVHAFTFACAYTHIHTDRER